MVRKAFKLAQTERPGAVYLAVPEDVEEAEVDQQLVPLRVNVPRPDDPSPGQVERAAAILREARNPIVLAGHGAARADAPATRCAGSPRRSTSRWPRRSTARASFPDDHPLALGAVGFMRHDYVNFGFDRADVIVAVGYELQEFDPVRINPRGDTQIIHIHRFPAEVDAHYDVAVGLHADIGRSLDALRRGGRRPTAATRHGGERIRELLADELDRGRADDRFPLAPARIVADTRAALDRDDIVLVDTGALKMWMARLYPTYEPNTCLISNGLSTMAWTVPGAIAAKIARPDAKVLVATGDGAFLMNSQEIETALRIGTPMVILIWVDDAYGLISWKMDLEIGHNVDTAFGNPDFVAVRRELRREGLPHRRRPTSCCRRCARRWPPTPCRSSPARSTTPPTASSSRPSANWTSRCPDLRCGGRISRQACCSPCSCWTSCWWRRTSTAS